MGERTANLPADLDAKMREHMRAWAQRLIDGTDQRDPVEDTADEVWRSLRVFADQYLELFAEVDKWRGVAYAFAQFAITVQNEAEGYRHGTPCYDITLDHLWECADVAMARYREAVG